MDKESLDYFVNKSKELLKEQSESFVSTHNTNTQTQQQGFERANQRVMNEIKKGQDIDIKKK